MLDPGRGPANEVDTVDFAPRRFAVTSFAGDVGVVSSDAVKDPAQGVWPWVRGRLLEEFGRATFESWLDGLHLVTFENDEVTLGARTRFLKDWIETHYLDRIADLWREAAPGVRRVQLIEANGGRTAQAAKPSTAVKAAQAASDAEDLDKWGSPLDPRFTFDSFVVGRSNELAHAAARRAAEAGDVPFNPLFLHGAVGLGKTHLMHAIAWEIRRRDPSKTVLYLSAEKFMFQFVSALRFKNTMAFKERFRQVDVLMVDDVQFIAGKDSTQEEFFHTFNALVDHRRLVVVSADRSPTDLDGIQERIRSRLGWGLVADIHATDYELRLGVLQNKAEEARAVHPEFDVPDAVLEFLARKVNTNVRELEGAFNRLVAHATLVGRPIEFDGAKELLADLLRASERRVTIDEIQRLVAEHYNIRQSDMLSARRARQVARPRQVAMFLAKKLTTRSLPDIGRRFGGRDHTTVMHAVKRVDALYAADPAIREDVDILRRRLVG